MPELSDPATSWREAEFLPHPNSSGRLVPEPSGMSVCRHNGQYLINSCIFYLSFKAGARLAQSPTFFPFPHKLLGFRELDSTRCPRRKPSGWGCFGHPVLPWQKEWPLSLLRTCREDWQEEKQTLGRLLLHVNTVAVFLVRPPRSAAGVQWLR